MTNQNSSDNGASEGDIARDKRKQYELGEGCLKLAEAEAEKLIARLGREPDIVERKLIEHFFILDARTRKLRKWGLHQQADAAAALLIKSGSAVKKIVPSSISSR